MAPPQEEQEEPEQENETGMLNDVEEYAGLNYNDDNRRDNVDSTNEVTPDLSPSPTGTVEDVPTFVEQPTHHQPISSTKGMDLDLFDLLVASQSDRMESQRSTHVPIDLLPTLDIPTTSIPKRRASRSDKKNCEPIESVASYYTAMPGSLEGIVSAYGRARGKGALYVTAKGAQEGNTDVLIKPRPNWFVEDIKTDLSLADSACEAQLKYLDPDFLYYRKHFFNQDHMNFVGNTDALGGIIVSVRRQQTGIDAMPTYLAIIRSFEGGTQRIEVSEMDIPRSNEVVTWTDVLTRILPSTIPLKCLRQARVDANLSEKLVKLDECLTGCMGRKGDEHYKFGVLHCRGGNVCEEQLYLNDSMTPALESFLEQIATKIELKGHEGFSAGLDVHDNGTGEHSYYTQFGSAEVMFHVSTLLPFTVGDTQQVARKRHIGNDCVTIIFQEENADAIDPEWFKSNFQEIFLVVKACKPKSNGVLSYRIQACWKDGIQEIFPSLLDGNLIATTENIRKFVLTKAINAEHAWYASPKSLKRSLRVRKELLKDVCESYSTDLPVEGKHTRMSALLPDLSRKMTIRSAKKKLGGDGVTGREVQGYGQHATAWLTKISREEVVCNVQLIISSRLVVFIDVITRSTIHHMSTSAIAGWSQDPRGLELLLDHKGGSILILADSALPDILRTFELHTQGCALLEIVLNRPTRFDDWGFLLESGLVIDVDPQGIACQAGLTEDVGVKAINGVTVTAMKPSQLSEHISTCGNTLRLKTCPASQITTVDKDWAITPAKRLFAATVSNGASEITDATDWNIPDHEIDANQQPTQDDVNVNANPLPKSQSDEGDKKITVETINAPPVAALRSLPTTPRAARRLPKVAPKPTLREQPLARPVPAPRPISMRIPDRSTHPVRNFRHSIIGTTGGNHNSNQSPEDILAQALRIAASLIGGNDDDDNDHDHNQSRLETRNISETDA